MINRNLIRIRVVQLVYSWYQGTNKDLRKAEKELLFGLQKSRFILLYVPINDRDHKNMIAGRNKEKQIPSHRRRY